MCSVWPVTQAESFDARNTAAGAMSTGWPIRPSGVQDYSSLRKSPSAKPAACTPAVATMPDHETCLAQYCPGEPMQKTETNA